jgi:hypothetical protein
MPKISFKKSNIGIKESSIADQDPGFGCLSDPWVRDLGWVKNHVPDPG